jgi:hypothetical protein
MVANVMKNHYFCLQIVKNNISPNNQPFFNGKD